jgi:plasmid stabilization system protein ParE
VPAGGRSDEGSSGQTAALIIDYHPEAAAELVESARFYEDRAAGLGQRFLDAVEASLAKLQYNPALGSADERGRRRWLVHRFPYLIIYRFDTEFLHVIAVAHTSRKPGYWASRDSGP